MKRILLLLSIALLAYQSFAQTEIFDIATYTPPKDWKKDAKQGVVNYSNVNMSNGHFCVLTIYASTSSTGDAKKDFNKAWKDLVVTPFSAEPNPTAETQATDEGWKVTSAVAPIKLDGADMIIMLSVITGFGKTMSVRASLNDEAYAADIDALFAGMELNKTKTTTTTNNNIATMPTTNEGGGKFGAMIYMPPPGWSHQVFGDGVVFKAPGLPASEFISIQIMQPLNFSGSLEQALQQSYNEAAAMYNGTKMNYAGTGKDYQTPTGKRSFQGWEYLRTTGGIRIGNQEYPPEYGLDLFVIKINNRFERVAVLKTRTINRSCSMSSYFADGRQHYKNAIDNFLFQLRFTDGPTATLPFKGLGGGGINGVWQGITMATGTPSVGAPAGFQYKVYSPIFLPNGQAYFGPRFPSEGLADLDTRVPAELYVRDWGTYSFSNGRGVLKMPYGDIPLRMEGDKLVITTNHTDHKFFQLPSVDGARFNGTYTMAEAYGKIPSITFTADGKFTDNGALRVLYHEYVDCLNPALTPGAGTYAVKDYTITFTYSDGRKIKIAFLGAEYNMNEQSPGVLRMSSNEDPMTRR